MRRALRRARRSTYVLSSHRGADGDWYVHAKDVAGHIVLATEGFSDRTEADDAAGRISRARFVVAPRPTTSEGN